MKEGQRIKVPVFPLLLRVAAVPGPGSHLCFYPLPAHGGVMKLVHKKSCGDDSTQTTDFLPTRKRRTRLFAFSIPGILFTVFSCQSVVAQTAPICGNDPTCTPDPGSGSYAGAVAARAKILNARGYSSPLVAKAPLRAAAGAASSSDTVIGSQSYNYAIPILRMPGRAGMDLVLNLYYNSRVWDVDTVNSTVTFNADRDFPSYGFRLDFGYVEISGNSVILTEGDGTKRGLAQGTDPAKPYMYYAIDGSHSMYNKSTNILTYNDGQTVQYSVFPSNANLLRPVWIKDSNGNYFSIAYVSGHDQLIYQISDSLGRVITFNYDSSNRLSSLTQFVHPSGTRTYATFSWGTPYTSGYHW